MEKPVVEVESDDDEWPYTEEELREIEVMKDIPPQIKDKDDRYPYLMRFRSTHARFRIPEVVSIAKMYNIPLEYDQLQAKLVESKHSLHISPFLRFSVPSIEDIKKLGSRSVTAQGFYKELASATSYEELVKNLKTEDILPYCDGTPFKFIVGAYGKKFTPEEQKAKMGYFSHLPIWDKSPVDIKNAKNIFYIMEDLGHLGSKDATTKRIYFSILICEGNVEIIDKYNLKKRLYIGTTSMDSELSLLVANQAWATDSSLIYDPFAGTGSLLVACSHFGSMTVGADIDSRSIRGKENNKTIQGNFKQYGFSNRLADLIICDQSRPIWRKTEIFDAIVADPPYGVREGARKVGKKNKSKNREHLQKTVENPTEAIPPRIPQCIPYPVTDILRDLVIFAAQRLLLGGKLVYWLPTVREDFKESDLPRHPCLEIVANSEQILSRRMARRLITMSKIKPYIPEEHDKLTLEDIGSDQVAHSKIADKWMNRLDINNNNNNNNSDK